MTDAQSNELMDKVQALVAEHATAFVFIMEIDDDAGGNATVRRKVGGDSAVIGMMELLKYDLLTGRFDSRSDQTHCD